MLGLQACAITTELCTLLSLAVLHILSIGHQRPKIVSPENIKVTYRGNRLHAYVCACTYMCMYTYRSDFYTDDYSYQAKHVPLCGHLPKDLALKKAKDAVLTSKQC